MSDSATSSTSTSRIYAASSIARTLRGYWKRSAASVTGFADKYRFDPFLRTEVNVVSLQILLAVFLLALVGFIGVQLYRDAIAAVTQGISAALTPGSSPVTIGNSVVSELGYTRSRTVFYAGGAIVLVTALFTYVIARLALAPTRNALESQKRFIGNIAHELRTPLSVIKTNTEVYLLDPNIPAAAKTPHEENLEELDRISQIINNLLTLSTSIRQERIEFTNVDLGAVAERVLAELRKLGERKRVDIELRMSDRRSVWGNASALEQIAMNIIKNAIQYSARDGHVTVVIEPVYPDRMEFRVRDSGSGIAREDLFHIFEPYFRTDPARERRKGGSGLGLTIVSELVKLHNGKISIRSAIGRGTTVIVLLPAGKEGSGGSKAARDSASEIAVDFLHASRRKS